MIIKTVYELDEKEVTILSAFLKIALDEGTMFKGTTLENLTVHNLYSQFKTNVNKDYFKVLLED